MVEFWIMIAIASTSGTVMGQAPSPPVYYTRELCEDAAKDLKQRTGGGDHMCVPARPLVQMQGNTVTIYPQQ